MMILRIGASMLCVGLLGLVGCSSDDASDGGAGGCVCQAASVTKCGHRGTGVTEDYPENTIASFEQAFSEGADMVELDVLHSADGVLVLMHDDTVDRTTSGSGCAGDLTVAELSQLDAAVGTPLEGTGVTVPTLAQVFEQIDGGLNVEVKMTGGGCPATDRDKLAADVVAQFQADTKQRRVMVSSFDLDVLVKIKALDSSIEVGYLDQSADTIDIAVAEGFEGVNMNFLATNAQVVADAHAAGLDFNVWTVNGDGLMGDMLDHGVDMIITDQPDVLAEVVAERCAAECP